MQQQRAPHADPGLEGQAKLQRVLRELPAKPTQRNARQHEEDVIAESRRESTGPAAWCSIACAEHD